MTNTELIQAIKTEIERHLNSATEHQNANPDMPKYRWYLYEGEKELCTDLLGYIDDSLESEKPMQEGLEEEIREYMSNEAYRREAFINGHEAAEKDIALTWEDIALIDDLLCEVPSMNKEEYYTEVLTRFKRFKEGKK